MNNKVSWRLAALLLGLCFAIVGIALKRRLFQTPLKEGVNTKGGTEMSVRIEVEPYLQTDGRWSDENLGPSDDKIFGYGCTLCAAAMALTANGQGVDPKILNERLTKGGGYTNSGLLIWKALGEVSGNEFRVIVEDRPAHSDLDSQLSVGNPVIAKVLYDGRIFHWVLITGKEGFEYLMHDPLGNGTAHDSMHEYPTGIYTIRYLEKR